MKRFCKLYFLLAIFSLAGIATAQNSTDQQSKDASIQQSVQTSSDNSKGTSRDQPTAKTAGAEKPETDKAPSDRQMHIRYGGLGLFAGGYWGPGFYRRGMYDGWGYPGAFWGPMLGPAYAPGYFTYRDQKGEIKLAADIRDAKVFLDGAYAGNANRLKSIWLEPGAYDLLVSASGRDPFTQRVYVLSGKTLRIEAKLPNKPLPNKEDKP